MLASTVITASNTDSGFIEAYFMIPSNRHLFMREDLCKTTMLCNYIWVNEQTMKIVVKSKA